MCSFAADILFIFYSMRQFFQKRVSKPIVDFLKNGIQPLPLAIAVTLGIVLGIFPVLGSTSILCAIVALVFRLNMPAIQLVNYFMYPLQLLLYIPFFKMGAWLFNMPAGDLTLTKVYELLKNTPIEGIKSLWWANVRAMAAWVLVVIIPTPILFFTFRTIFVRVAAKLFNANQE